MEDRILERVRGLLAKAESTDSADERLALIGKVQQLQAKYNIDAAKLQAAGTAPAEEVTTVRLDVARPRQSGGKALLSLVFALAKANGAVAVGHEGGGGGTRATVVGFGSDVRAVQTLFGSLCRQLERAAAYAVRNHKPAGVHGLTYRVSYAHGWVDTVAGRLADARRDAVAQAAAEDAGTGPASTALVLRSRAERVDGRKRELFPKLGTFRDGYRSEMSGYRRGAADGSRAALGGEVAAGAAPAALPSGTRA